MRIGGKADELESVLAKAGESSKNLDATLKKLGNTPIGQEATRSATQLNDVLKQVTDQQQRLADRARLAASGLDSLGGPAKLTKEQLDQVNVTIQKGIDAFRALGKQAPESLERMAAAVQAQQKALDAGSKSTSIFSGLQGALFTQIAAVAGPAALGLLIKGTLDYADTLTKLSDRTGIGTVALQRLEAIAKPSGNTLEELAGAINKFQKNLADSDKGAGDALRNLGLSFHEIRALSPDEQFIAIAKAIQGVKDPAEQTLIAMQLFGKGGAEILPSLKAKVDELKDSTGHMSADSVRALDDLGDELAAFKDRTVHLVGGIVAELVKIPRALAHPDTAPRLDSAQAFSATVGAMGGFTNFAALSTSPRNAPLRAVDNDSLPGIITPNVASQSVAALEQIRAALQVQQAMADRLGLSLDEYQKKLAEVDAKIRLATASTGGLSEAQKIQASTLNALSLSQDDIALKLGTSTAAVKNYFDAIKAGATEEQAFMDRMVAMLKLDHDAEQATTALSLAISEHLIPNTVSLAENVATLGTRFERFAGDNEAVAVHLQKTNDNLTEFGIKVFANNFKVKDATDGMKRLGDALTTLSGDFVQMAQISGGTFSNIAKDIGLAIKAADSLNKALAISGIAGKSPDAQKPGGIEANAVVGFGASAAGLGTAAAVGNTLAIASAWVAVGVAVYGVISAISKANEEAAQAAQKLSRVIDLSNQFGTTSLFSGSLSDAIETTNTRLDDLATSLGRAGNDKALSALFDTKTLEGYTGHLERLNGIVQRTADYYGRLHELAASLNLSDIIKELGGVEQLTSAQLVTVQKHFHDLFSLISVGGPIAVDATKAMDDALVKFADQAVNSDGFVSNLFLETVRQAKAAGIELAGVNQFIQGQLTRAAGGLTALFGGLDASAKARATAAGQNPDNAGFTVTSQTQGEGLGAAIAGTFAGLRAGGASFREALTAIQGPLDSLNKALANTGFSGGAAFAGLTKLADIASDAITGPLVDAISGANDAIKGLGNADLLTQGSFSALASTATNAYQQIIAQGKDGAAALEIMRPTLQTLWEGEQQFGFTVDDSTQALIDQAVANGTVGEQMKSTQGQILDVLIAIGKVLGADIPEGLRNMGQAGAEAAGEVQQALLNITAPDLTVRVGFDDGGGYQPTDQNGGNVTPGYAGGSGGIRDFGAGTTVRLHGREAVFTEDQLRSGRVLPFWSRDAAPALSMPFEIAPNAPQQPNVSTVLSTAQQDSHDTYEIHVHAVAGQDPQAIAEAVAQRIARNTNGLGTKIKRGLEAA